MKNEVFEKFNCGMLKLPGKTISFDEIEWSKHPVFEGVELKHIIKGSETGGNTWHNMPGSPVRIDAPKLNLGIYQTTYSENLSWAKLKNNLIYQR